MGGRAPTIPGRRPPGTLMFPYSSRYARFISLSGISTFTPALAPFLAVYAESKFLSPWTTMASLPTFLMFTSAENLTFWVEDEEDIFYKEIIYY